MARSDPRPLDRLHALARDREHGAAWVVRQAAETLARAESPLPADELRAGLIALRAGQPGMAPVLRFCRDLWAALDNDPAAVPESARHWAQTLATASGRIASTFRDFPLPHHPVLLYSASSTVTAALDARDWDPGQEFAVAISRPGGEGERVARSLAERGRAVTLLSDPAAFDRAADRPHTLLLGCDALTGRRFQNKTGSGALARLVRQAGGTVLLLSDLGKLLPDALAEELAPSDAGPLIEGSEAALASKHGPGIVNPLFGWGSMDDVDAVLCEDGVLTVDAILRRAERMNPALPDELRRA